jgi:precorrin-6B methylase 2
VVDRSRSYEADLTRVFLRVVVVAAAAAPPNSRSWSCGCCCATFGLELGGSQSTASALGHPWLAALSIARISNVFGSRRCGWRQHRHLCSHKPSNTPTNFTGGDGVA